jgi:hypothetical protein
VPGGFGANGFGAPTLLLVLVVAAPLGAKGEAATTGFAKGLDMGVAVPALTEAVEACVETMAAGFVPNKDACETCGAGVEPSAFGADDAKGTESDGLTEN